MSKANLERRVGKLEYREGVGEANYVYEIEVWRPDGVDKIYWLMRPTADGKGECVKVLTEEEAKAIQNV